MQDVLAGWFLVALVVSGGYFWADALDTVFTGPTATAPLSVLGISVVCLMVYPYGRAVHTTKSDTAIIVGVFCGTFIGLWLSTDIPADTVDGLPFPTAFPSTDQV